MDRQIETGSKPLSIRAFDRNKHSECVIHLIYPDLDMVLESDDSEYEIETANDLSEYISDQIPELWEDLRHGDILEDISRVGDEEESMRGVYVVTRSEESDTFNLINHGLRISELEWSSEREEWVIPSEFTAITKFPFGYHDHHNMVVNNTYARGYDEPLSEWTTIPCPVPLDLKKLRLDKKNLTSDHIFECIGNGLTFSYVVLMFRGQNYLIGTDDTSSVLRYRLGRTHHAGHYGFEGIDYLPSGLRNVVFDVLREEKVILDNFFVL
jgi:hypothetical protein